MKAEKIAVMLLVFFLSLLSVLSVMCAVRIIQLEETLSAGLEAIELSAEAEETIVEYNNEVILYNQGIKETNERALQQQQLQRF